VRLVYLQVLWVVVNAQSVLLESIQMLMLNFVQFAKQALLLMKVLRLVMNVLWDNSVVMVQMCALVVHQDITAVLSVLPSAPNVRPGKVQMRMANLTALCVKPVNSGIVMTLCAPIAKLTPTVRTMVLSAVLLVLQVRSALLALVLAVIAIKENTC
jgi:hypothetical protein